MSGSGPSRVRPGGGDDDLVFHKETPRAELRTRGAGGLFVGAYLACHNILYPRVMFWQHNIIPQPLCLAVIPQSLKDYQKSHPYVGKQMREREKSEGGRERGWCRTWPPPPLAVPTRALTGGVSSFIRPCRQIRSWSHVFYRSSRYPSAFGPLPHLVSIFVFPPPPPHHHIPPSIPRTASCLRCASRSVTRHLWPGESAVCSLSYRETEKGTTVSALSSAGMPFGLFWRLNLI